MLTILFRCLSKIHFFLIVIYLPYLAQANEPEVWNITARNKNFFGREAELLKISEIFKSGNLVYLSGIGGVGKTQIAKEYAHRNLDYDVVWLVDCTQNLSLQYEELLRNIQSSTKLAKYISLDVSKTAPNAIIQYTNDILRKSKFSWLIIFDNFSNTAKKHIPETHGNIRKHILITTREKIPQYIKNTIMIGSFSEVESVYFLQRLLNKASKEDLIRLSRHLTYFPLNLCHGASYILRNRISINEYIQLYNVKEPPSDLKTGDILLDNYDKTVERILSISLNNISHALPSMREAIFLLGSINSQIPQNLFERIIQDVVGEYTTEVVSKLLNNYILEYRIVNGRRYYYLHDVLRKSIETQLDNDKRFKQKIFIKLIRILINHFDQEEFKKHKSMLIDRSIVLIAQNIFNTTLSFYNGSDEVLLLGLKLLRANNILFYKHASYEDYQNIAYKLHLMNNRICLDKRLQALLCLELIFADFVYQDSSSKDLFAQNILKSITHLQGQFSDEFLAYTYAAQYYLFLGEIRQSYHYIRKAEHLVSYASNPLDIIQFMYTYSWLSVEMNNFKEGLKKTEEFRKIGEKFSNNQIVSLYYLNLKGKLYYLAGDYDNATVFAQLCMNKSYQYYRSKFSDTYAEGLITMAQINLDLNRIKTANVLLLEAKQILHNVFGYEDIDLTQAFTHTLFGEIYEKERHLSQALKEYINAEKCYEKVQLWWSIELTERTRLYKDFVRVYYLLKDFKQSLFYFKRLLDFYDFNHPHIKSLLMGLNRNYVNKISAYNEK